MKPKPIRPQTKAIQERFFTALNECIRQGKISGLKGFCRDYNLNRVKYSSLRINLNSGEETKAYRLIDIDALSYLVKDFDVSAEWLLTGKGNMYR